MWKEGAAEKMTRKIRKSNQTMALDLGGLKGNKNFTHFVQMGVVLKRSFRFRSRLLRQSSPLSRISSSFGSTLAGASLPPPQLTSENAAKVELQRKHFSDDGSQCHHQTTSGNPITISSRSSSYEGMILHQWHWMKLICPACTGFRRDAFLDFHNDASSPKHRDIWTSVILSCEWPRFSSQNNVLPNWCKLAVAWHLILRCQTDFSCPTAAWSTASLTPQALLHCPNAIAVIHKIPPRLHFQQVTMGQNLGTTFVLYLNIMDKWMFLNLHPPNETNKPWLSYISTQINSK